MRIALPAVPTMGLGSGSISRKRRMAPLWDILLPNRNSQGYSGMVHGGVIATLLDSAMTHCLLKKGIFALTGRLSIRYSSPIRVGTVVKLEARVIKRLHKVFFLQAKAFVEEKKAACAEASYMLRR